MSQDGAKSVYGSYPISFFSKCACLNYGPLFCPCNHASSSHSFWRLKANGHVFGKCKITRSLLSRHISVGSIVKHARGPGIRSFLRDTVMRTSALHLLKVDTTDLASEIAYHHSYRRQLFLFFLFRNPFWRLLVRACPSRYSWKVPVLARPFQVLLSFLNAPVCDMQRGVWRILMTRHNTIECTAICAQLACTSSICL